MNKNEDINVLLLMLSVISICGGLLLTNVFIYSPLIGWLVAVFCLIMNFIYKEEQLKYRKRED
ncbi:hypothetical protein ABFY59_30395 [Priestia aryabhattai]|jgi:hypothetical protein|uniref:hypothetical protein n=1 Tax=Priestia TaxID=2800373 RepID=UPI000BF950F1|nr:hypothetical protein [Priestia megaterium]MED4132576.1 hypothetical protein [Priestia megaterium]PFP08551.1 hypothetical protein COJ92_30040 [Priestia megaterium]PFU53205.1 hypothetical protein COK90_30450 [Priestia megaterium]